ncbi:TPA: ribulose-phosphate 3-epimerase [Candidatus Woesearchaeota archaeon]|nr:ribulose-phosphate 3-epimerase [Candidatus Woesearchaeota archaeon]
MRIAPSILSADFKRINGDIGQVEKYADLIHVDVMDGKFVPPTTVDSDFVRTIRTKLPLDVHLMVQEPSEGYIQGFIDAGASSITVHAEACTDPRRQLGYIKGKGINAGISIKPKTPLSAILPCLDTVDMVLIMTVEPGWGGQKFMEDTMPKVRELRKLKPNLDIEVDGGIYPDTAPLAKKAGANVFVAGTAIFKEKDRVMAIKRLRESVS